MENVALNAQFELIKCHEKQKMQKKKKRKKNGEFRVNSVKLNNTFVYIFFSQYFSVSFEFCYDRYLENISHGKIVFHQIFI